MDAQIGAPRLVISPGVKSTSSKTYKKRLLCLHLGNRKWRQKMDATIGFPHLVIFYPHPPTKGAEVRPYKKLSLSVLVETENDDNRRKKR